MTERFPTESEGEALPEAEEVLTPEGVELPASMQEYAAEQEKMADAQFELVREFQQEEKKALASLEANNEGKGESLGERAKKGFAAVTAGVMLMMAVPAFGGELQKGRNSTDAQSIEQQAQKPQQEDFEQMRMGILKRAAQETLQAIKENISDKDMQREAQALVRSLGHQFMVTGDMAYTVMSRAGIEPSSHIKFLIGERRGELLDTIRALHASVVTEGKNFDLRKFMDSGGIGGFSSQEEFEHDRTAEELYWVHTLNVDMKGYQERAFEPTQQEP